MAANTTSGQHRGWRWDEADSRLEVVVNGTEIAAFNSDGFSLSSGGLALSGRVTGTQQTDKGTALTLDGRAGTITMDNASLTAGTEVSFVVTNSSVGVNDVIILSIGAATTTANAYTSQVSEVTAGTFNITISNATGGTLSEAVVLNFAVIKVTS